MVIMSGISKLVVGTAGTAVDPASPGGGNVDPLTEFAPDPGIDPALLSFSGGAWEYVDPSDINPDTLKWALFSIGTGATQISTGVIPDDAAILQVLLLVDTVFDNGATVKIEREGDATKVILEPGDSDLATEGAYSREQLTFWESTGSGAVKATVANAPTVGLATVGIAYAFAADIT